MASEQGPDEGWMSLDALEHAVQVGLERRECPEQVVADVGAADPAPHALDEIELGAVGRQPEDVEKGPDILLLKKRLDSLGLVDAGVVGDEDNPPSRSLRPTDQILDQDQEPPGDFPGQPDEFPVPVSVLDHPEDELFAILARSGDRELAPLQPPSPCEMGMEMTFGLVLVPEFEVGAGFKGFFFRRESRFWAFRYAASFRLPLSVCLGRP